MVGSIIPSSRTLIERMLEPVDWETTRLFVEYGPGVGTFTRPILEKLGEDATLIAIDTNAEFIRYLRQSIPDKRLVAVAGSAADVENIVRDHGFKNADYVVSGIPFSTLPPGIGEAIGKATAKVLRPGGAFLVYQFSAKVFDFIEPWFDRIDRGFEWINVPPAKLFWAWKAQPPAKSKR
ncbi:MAG: methyltransferase domain-containing protein [Sphingomicrobium sp.]